MQKILLVRAFSELTWNHRETTPLIDRGIPRRKLNVIATACAAVILVVFLAIWGPYVLSGVYFEKRKWQKELVRWHEAEQFWQREEEARQRLGLHWDAPIADSHCTAHNTREYWARLLDTVPYNYNWLKPCEDIPIDIHGRSIKTTRCYISPYVRSFIQPSAHGDYDYC